MYSPFGPNPAIPQRRTVYYSSYQTQPNKFMSTEKDKFYRAKKDSFLWKQGAILLFDKKEGSDGGYEPIEEGLWEATENNGEEYISARIIENTPEWFERVYPTGTDSITGKVNYQDRENVMEKFNKQFKI